MGYTELVPIATALGVTDAGKGELRCTRDGFPIFIELRIDSGVVRGVDVRVEGRDWPEAELRRETDSDRASKASGMNVEVQTGDRMFDDFVYIESPYRQAVLAPLLQSPALRQELGQLVAQHGTVSIDERGLTVDTRGAGTDLLAPARFIPLLDTLIRLAKLLPRVPKGAPKEAERGGLLMLLSAGALVFSAIFPAFLTHYGAPLSSGLRPLGLAAGVVLALIAIPLVKLWVRGHSRARTYWLVTSIALVLGQPLLFMSLAVVVNAALDPSPSEKLAGKVVAARNYLDDSEPLVEVSVAWTNKTTESLTLKDTRPIATKIGDDVRAVRRAGLLGFAWWEAEPAVVR